jgi:hypothetical protein
MDSNGLDIADNNTSAGKEGDAVSTQRVYKCVNTFYTTFLPELDKLDIDLVSKDMYTFLTRGTLSIASSFVFLSRGTSTKLYHTQSCKQSSDASSM